MRTKETDFDSSASSTSSATSVVENWKNELLEAALDAANGHEYWQARLCERDIAVHLAIFVEPYLSYIIDGKKTVESRFSANRCAPYKQARRGDVILLKRAGGPVIGLCEVGQVWNYELDPASFSEIRTDFAKALCAQDPQFWHDRQTASFATLMRVGRITTIKPFSCSKRDRRGWVVVRQAKTYASLVTDDKHYRESLVSQPELQELWT